MLNNIIQIENPNIYLDSVGLDGFSDGLNLENDLQELIKLATNFCQTSIAAIALQGMHAPVKKHQQLYVTSSKLSVEDEFQANIFCSEVLLSNQLIIVNDALYDARFSQSIATEESIRFFVGFPLALSSGDIIGVFFVADKLPKQLSHLQLDMLKLLSAQITAQYELDRFQEIVGKLSEERQSINNALVHQTTLLHEAQRIAEVGSWDLIIDQKKLSWSKEVFRIFGQDDSEPEQSFEGFLSAVHPEDCVGLLQAQELALKQLKPLDFEHRIIRPNGEVRFVHEKGRLIFSEHDNKLHFIGTVQDITERNKKYFELAMLNRVLQMSSASNDALLHVTDESELFLKVCQIAVNIGNYACAWVGITGNPIGNTFSSSIHYARQDINQVNEYHGIAHEISFQDPLDPILLSVQNNEFIFIQDTSQNERLTPSLIAANLSGFKGMICLPLVHLHETFGVLVLYSDDIRQIPDAEIKLLKEMGNNLAFGVRNIHIQNDRNRLQNAMMKVATSVSTNNTPAFFKHLVSNMVEALDADGAIVSRLNANKTEATTIINFNDGEFLDNFVYFLSEVEHATANDNESNIFTCKLHNEENHFFNIHKWPTSTCFGSDLKNSNGHLIGSIFVFFKEEPKNTKFIESTSQIFAARAAAELERQDSDSIIQEQASLLDKTHDAILVLDIDHKIQFWSKGAERLYGWKANEVVGLNIETIFINETIDLQHALKRVKAQKEWNGELHQHKKDGSKIIVDGRWTLVFNEGAQPHAILGINTDVTQKKVAADEIQQLAFYDVLTQLPNRQLLRNRLQHLFESRDRLRNAWVLLFIDLDNFKTLNDTMGHDKGDMLLQEVARRLTNCVRKSDTVARLGGDEFVILFESVGNADVITQATIVGEKVLSCFHEPFSLGGYPYYSSPSVGITLFDENCQNADDLLKHADIAMYQAKFGGKNSLRFFNPDMRTAVTAKLELEADLRSSFKQQEFTLYYQPQVDDAGKVTGVEALLRWFHKERGAVSPLDFIPIAEETGLIFPLGCWVMHTACEQLSDWSSDSVFQNISIAVNVSARQFRHPEFVSQVLNALTSTGANPYLLKLELTESLLLENVEETISKMTELKKYGVCFSLDDFGTGYSSLYYLKRLPLDQLKIDRSFVNDVLTDTNDNVIVKTIIALGKSLGLEVIAEGVETSEQRDFLLSHDCNAHQGYFFSKPLPTSLLNDFIKQQNGMNNSDQEDLPKNTFAV
ncbi:EAL domain-containing protein [Methylotenera sp. 73s]|nr:EAL domain-containing protein [Methylotenera sp. 73s]